MCGEVVWEEHSVERIPSHRGSISDNVQCKMLYFGKENVRNANKEPYQNEA